jgi:hypothetical protein
MAQIPQTNVSMAAINTEVASVNSHSLTTLSTNGNVGGGTSTLNGIAPHGMGEFRGYVHSTPYSSVMTGQQLASVAGASITAADADSSFTNYFDYAYATPGLDFRIYMYYYGAYGHSSSLFVTKSPTTDNAWYDNINNVSTHMGTNTINIASVFNADFAAANEIKLEFNTSYAGPTVTGSTANTSSSISVSGNGGATTTMANNTWYPITNGTFSGGARLAASFQKGFQSTGTAHFESTTWLKIWVRNTSLAKAETVIREQDIRLYGDATIISGGGGGCPLCCVHDSMLIATEEDMKSIYDISIGDKVISHNFETGKDEVVEVTDIIIVDRDVDYKINDLVMTEDHPVYLEGGRKASLNPDATLLNYKQEVDQLVIGDRMMKLDGTLEEITSIEKFEGEHKNFAVQTKHNNFYANGHLVDSVINRGTK